LPELKAALARDDILFITADHGCDPTTPGTDHTREYVPVLAWSPAMKWGVEMETRKTFADLGKTVAELLGLSLEGHGQGFTDLIGVDQ
jgi:phosphopentomutase